jgi:hypothetical protein
MGRSQARVIDRNRVPADGVQVAVVTKPAITGTTTSGQTLTAAATVSAGGPTRTEARQWFRFLGNTATLIGGATGATYVLQAGDVGRRIAVRSTITQARSTPRVVWSDLTAIVA